MRGPPQCKQRESPHKALPDKAHRKEKSMISVAVEYKQGSITRRARVVAPAIERAVEIAADAAGASGTARVEFPIDAGEFFAPANNPGEEGIDYAAMSQVEIEGAYEAGLPGAYRAWLDVLEDDLGPEGFEAYAFDNSLI